MDNKPICLTCTHFACEWLIKQVKENEAPSIAWSGACPLWEKDAYFEVASEEAGVSKAGGER